MCARNAMKCWDEGGDFRQLVSADKDIAAHLSEKQIDEVFSLDRYLRNVAISFRQSLW
jgi:adenylosuccinate lyase